METNNSRFSSENVMESIKSLTEKDAKTFLNLIYALVKDNTTPSEKLLLQVLSIYEKQMPRVVKAREKQ